MFSQAAEKIHKCDNNRRMKGLQIFCGMRSQIYLHSLCSLCDVLMSHKCEKKCFQKIPNFSSEIEENIGVLSVMFLEESEMFEEMFSNASKNVTIMENVLPVSKES